MAQLGDTIVLGDLHATGKIWSETSRVYISDYNTFDPTKLNIQAGEMVTVYNTSRKYCWNSCTLR